MVRPEPAAVCRSHAGAAAQEQLQGCSVAFLCCNVVCLQAFATCGINRAAAFKKQLQCWCVAVLSCVVMCLHLHLLANCIHLGATVY